MNMKKRAIVFAICVVVGLWIANFIWPQFFSPRAVTIREYEAAKERAIAYRTADTFGGKTPEETLALFVAALEKGDTETAAKYFVYDRMEEMGVALEKGQVRDGNKVYLEILKLTPSSVQVSDRTSRAYVSIQIPGHDLPYDIDLYRDSYSKLWKIEDL